MYVPCFDVCLVCFFPCRFKGYLFQEAGLSFELPKQLALSDISVRILHTRYDHLSHLSLRTQAQKKSPAREKEAEADPETLSENPKALEDGDVKGEDEGQEGVPQEKDDIQSLKSSEGKKVRCRGSRDKCLQQC